MIVLSIIILLIAIISIGLSLYMYLDFKKREEYVLSKMNTLSNDIHKEIQTLSNDINYLKKNPAEFTKRFTNIDFRFKKLEDIISTFNNGFKQRESWM